MINIGIHNVTDIFNVRISKDDRSDKAGWIVLDILAQQYSWDDGNRDNISNSISLYCQDLEYTYARLIKVLDDGMKTCRKEALEKKEPSNG